MKKLDNLKLVKTRIVKLSAKAPAGPLKGAGHVRRPISSMPLVFARLEKLAPAHCSTITTREAVNSFGKLGYVAYPYISPELGLIVEANIDDFRNLESALALAAQFGL